MPAIRSNLQIKGSFDGLLLLATGVTLLATLLGFGGQYSWFCELCANFRPQLIAGQIVLIAAIAWSRRWLVAGTLTVFAMINLAVVWKHFEQTGDPPRHRDAAITLTTMNVNWTNDRRGDIAALLSSSGSDIIVLQEVTPAWLGTIDALRQHYPHVIHVLRDDPFGIALLSRVPILEQRIHRLGESESPAIEIHAEFGGRRIAVFGVHLEWPLTPAGYARRSMQIHELAEKIHAAGTTRIVCGDFNVPPWSDWMSTLLRESGIGKPGRGYNASPTWPARIGPLGLPLDNCIFTPDLRAQSSTLEPIPGSDHRSLTSALIETDPGAN